MLDSSSGDEVYRDIHREVKLLAGALDVFCSRKSVLEMSFKKGDI